MARVGRSLAVLAACGMCTFGGSAAVAVAAAHGHDSAGRAAHAAARCRHTKHPHCRKRHGGKAHRGHRRGASAPKGATKGSGAAGASPWTATPAPVIPGSTPGSSGTGTGPSGPAGGTPPTTVPTAPAGPEQVQVTAEDTEGFHFILSRASVAAGPVIIEFVNHGQDEHNLHAVEPTEGAEAGSLPNTAPKGHPTLKLNLHAGSYTLFCSLPHHEEKGMKATLVVE
jgi:plastocyanin